MKTPDIPAFPWSFGNGSFTLKADDAEAVKFYEGLRGMSLRDYFAAQALNGSIKSSVGWPVDPAEQAAAAYRFADAMLAERAK